MVDLSLREKKGEAIGWKVDSIIKIDECGHLFEGKEC